MSSYENVNRVSFGNSIWKNIILPSISHGCPVWLNNSNQGKALLKSMQYSMAKAIIGVRSMPAVTAVLGEFGWLPLKLVLDRIRVKYFHRIKYDMPESRICKQVFNRLVGAYSDGEKPPWPYIEEIHEILKNAGLDSAFTSRKDTWPQSYHKLSLESYKIEFFQEIDDKSSLNWFRILKGSTFGSKYLEDVGNFSGVRLKFLARVGCLGLNEDLARWGLASEKCGLCNREKEDLPHFMFKCTKMNHIRTKYVYMLENQLKECGMEHIWYKYIGSSTLRKLSFFLFEEGFDYGKMVSSMFATGVSY